MQCYHRAAFRFCRLGTHLISILLIVFVTALLATWLWSRLALQLHWLDLPNHRSSHVRPTVTGGGTGFVLAFTLFVSLLYFNGQLSLQYTLLSATALLLAVTGLLDDKRHLSIKVRIGMQLLASCLALGLVAVYPPLVFPWGAVDAIWILLPLCVLGLVWLINLYNFMDGIDALAASEAIFCSLALAVLSSISADGGPGGITTLCLGLAVAVSGFLYFNLPPARIFMGDVGSNYLGFMLGSLGLAAVVEGSVSYWTLLVLSGIFIVDATTTLLARIRAKAVWYHAHRSHAYQRAALIHASHGKVVMVTALINILWLLPLAWLTTVQDQWGFFIAAIAWLPLFVLVARYRNMQTKTV